MTIYKATFTDGTVLTRNTKRTYSHAWLIRGTYKSWQTGEPRPFEFSGFSGTLELARKQLAHELPTDTIEVSFSEAAITIEVDKQGNPIVTDELLAAMSGPLKAAR